MLPNVVVKGAREAYELLDGIADRARDTSYAWADVARDVFAFQAAWWLLEYGTKRDQDRRPGREPRYMEETGGLRKSVTVPYAKRQTIQARPGYLLIEVTHGLAVIHENRGRAVLGEPGPVEARKYAQTVADFILTGRRT